MSKKENVSNNIYDYFNIWFAFLLDPVKPDDDPDKIVSDMTMELHNEYDKLISSLDSIVIPTKKEVVYKKGKKHIRFSNLTYNLGFNEAKIDLKIKIRINPCILSHNSKAHHTKIWAIFYNEEPQNLSSKDLSKIVKELEQVALKIKGFILPISKKYLNKNNNKSVYKIKMVNSSLHQKCNLQYKKELKDIFVLDKENSTLEHFRQKAKKINFTKHLFKDLFILNEVQNPNDINRNIASIKDQISWKIIKSNYYNTISRISSEDNETKIASISSINDDENKLRYLYSEPLKKAIDMSETL